MESVFAETIRAMIDYWMVTIGDQIITVLAVMELAAQTAWMLINRSNSAPLNGSEE
jgi:hypothetical protein